MNDEIKDSYSALELKPDASPEAVKEAYRELVKVWHPDRFSGDAKLEQRALEKLKRINLAYERIKNRKPKKATAAEPQGNAPPPSSPRRRTPSSPEMAPGVKTYVLPNSRDVKLGCLLVGGLACLIGSLIIAAIFYDESTAGRLYVTEIGGTKARTNSPTRVGDSNLVELMDTGRSITRSDIDPGRPGSNSNLTVEAVEQQLEALEEKARASAIELINRPSSTGRADETEEETAPEIVQGTGKRLDFVTEGFYSTGIAHLRSGRGKREFVRAADYFLLASNRGHPDAQYQLAVMLRDGTGGEADPERALYWISVSAALGQKEALRSRASFEIGMTARRVDELKAEALRRIEDFEN